MAGGAGLLLLSLAALGLAAAPAGQWYLAWVGLAPWLIVVGNASTLPAALWRGWLAGAAYFAIHLWWLWAATIPGTVVLILYFALYWALAAGLVQYLRLLRPASPTEPPSLAIRVLAIATAWVAAEWLRCNLLSGFPWLPLGSTQTPLPVMCQVADLGGPWIVSFWVALPSALLASMWFERHNLRAVSGAALLVLAVVTMVFGYGAWRMHSTVTTPGPRILLLQSNFPHLPGGAPTVERDEAAEFYLAEIERALDAEPADLVILPEAALPPINDEARAALARSPVGPFLEETHQRLLALARRRGAAILIGGNAVTGWTTQDGAHVGTEIRNSAYYFDPLADDAPSRYDKMHLVPFSERAPLQSAPQWIRRIAMSIAAGRASQPMHAGELAEFQPFELRAATSSAGEERDAAARFIAPICLENVDPRVIARMLRDPAGAKRADFVANLSNDGWFASQQKHQHLQTTVLRCIENRVPMARSSNTGISGFIDSTGRVVQTLAPGTAGFAAWTIELDHRTTFYTQYGDVFSVACVLLVMVAIARRMSVTVSQRRRQ